MRMSSSGGLAGRLARGVLLAAVVLAASVASAQAATYTVWSCKTPAGTPTSVEGWSMVLGLPTMAPSQDCAAGGTLGSNFAASDRTFTGNQRMGWEFTAPADTTVTDIRTNWAYIVGHNGSDSNASAAVGIYRDGFDWPVDVLWQCQAYYTDASYCYSGGGTSDFTINASRFGFDAGCYGESYGTCGPSTYGKSVIAFGDTRIHLDDPYAPEFSSVSGVPSGPVRGALGVGAALTDRGGGLWQSEVRLGATILKARSTLSVNGGRCSEVNVEAPANEFGVPQPCPRALSGSWSVDTTKVADGQHLLTITVWDAANNATKVVNQTITVENSAGPLLPGGGGSASAGTITVAAPAGIAKFGAKTTITGRLTDPAGAPIAGASVRVVEQPTFTGAPTTPGAAVTTDARGGFSYVTSPSSSRTVTFSYNPTADASASASAVLRVRGAVRLSTRRRTLRHGSTAVFTGRVRTAPLPAKGARVLIEVRAGGAWQPAKLLRTNAAGRFRWSRRLRAVTTYRFRARVLRDAEFPAEPAASTAISLRLF